MSPFTVVQAHGLCPTIRTLRSSTLRAVFDEFDSDNSGTIDADEVQALLLGLTLSSQGDGGGGMPPAVAVDKVSVGLWMAEMDADADSQISFDGEWGPALVAEHRGLRLACAS